eukprot:423150-Rhodomonas_salina.1
MVRSIVQNQEGEDRRNEPRALQSAQCRLSGSLTVASRIFCALSFSSCKYDTLRQYYYRQHTGRPGRLGSHLRDRGAAHVEVGSFQTHLVAPRHM